MLCACPFPQEAVETAQRGARNVPVTQQSLPPIRLQVIKVASEVRWGRMRGGAPLLPVARCCWPAHLTGCLDCLPPKLPMQPASRCNWFAAGGGAAPCLQGDAG